MPRPANDARAVAGEPSGPRVVPSDSDLDRIGSAVRGIRYGEVRVVIQDGVIVQIERVERQRLR